MKVLVVDDSAAMRMLVKRTLLEAGYTAMQFCDAGDGVDALQCVDAFGPELVLCDWNMPKMNGLELLLKIRESGSAVKFGFVTTESTTPMRETARTAGAQFLLSKPFTATSLTKALRPVIGPPCDSNYLQKPTSSECWP